MNCSQAVRPQAADRGVGLAPLVVELLERPPARLAGWGDIDRFQIGRDLSPVALRGVAEGVADQVDHAGLHDRLAEHRADGVGQSFEAVADDEEDVFDAAVLQLGQDLEPELRRFPATVTGPDPRMSLWPARSTPIAA